MSKDYMKSGEIRQGDSLHFDGVGYYTRPTTNHLKVNKWMLKQGYTWEQHTVSGIGTWVQLDGDSDPIDQNEAVKLYQNRRKWWRFWL